MDLLKNTTEISKIRRKLKYINTTRSWINGKILAKFIPLDRAFDSLDKGSLWFANPEKWTDPFESYFLNNSYHKGQIDHDCILKGKVLSTCFTTRSRSEAQWKAYSEKDIALMVEIPADDLVKALVNTVGGIADIYIGKVRYIPTWKIKKNISWEILGITQQKASSFSEEELCVRLMLQKRKPYSYENEIRIFLVFKKELIPSEKDGKYISNTLTKSLVNRITISPLAGAVTRKKLKKYFSAKGYQTYFSTLYSDVTNQVIELP